MVNSPFVKMIITEQMLDQMRVNLSFIQHKISVEPVCDFCGGEAPRVVYQAKRMGNGLPVSCWRWCSCSICEEIVDQERWDDLRNRVKIRLKKLLPANGMITEEVINMSIQQALNDFLQDAVRAKGNR